jgi:hypothetical protein
MASTRAAARLVAIGTVIGGDATALLSRFDSLAAETAIALERRLRVALDRGRDGVDEAQDVSSEAACDVVHVVGLLDGSDHRCTKPSSSTPALAR